MALQTYQTGANFTFVDNAASNNVTIDLPAPGAGLAWEISSILIYTVTAVSVWDVQITKADTTTKIARVGQTGAQLPGVITGPIATKANDAPHIVLGCTGATAVQLTVNATLKPGV